ncbi:tRNA epoxyqueuosine(34) reductase QueG [Leeia sp. TBRC 13508]|uniref:Epoxyqueuosine reductase n=1 Tax=Leeia speluncae TaxID=2884804 RepID=A0ABS8D6A5_9NEIS|nr:tRNA epoxyqueuosine(34) reductase QueG [Leeia speluncae]MCB6183506.1 tRNA epoxyqueuosine(34) reductase QueG [Leeia speluncae]
MSHSASQSSLSTELLSDLVRQLKTTANTLGFSEVGITDTDLSAEEPRFLNWLAQGYHGEMAYMERHGLLRARPHELHAGTVRVISVKLPYLQETPSESIPLLNTPNKAYISRYALGRDYHKVVKQKLEQLAKSLNHALQENGFPHQYRVFTDSAPLMEVALASKAGIGWKGKHTLLIHRQEGSYFFLGEILTNLPLPVDAPIQNHCGKCTQCISICPTQAIVAPYEVDARRCISYLTIEYSGSIPAELRPLMGNRIYGCDDCQLFCPWNRFAKLSDVKDFAIRHQLENQTLLQLFSWTEDAFLNKMAGSAIYRIGYHQWLRNIAIAIGNAPFHPDNLAALSSRLDIENEIVREHIEWAISEQQKNSAGQTSSPTVKVHPK